MRKQNVFYDNIYLKTDWDGNLDFTISSSNNSFQLVFKGKSENRVSCPKK